MPTIGLIYLLYFLRMLGLFCILPVFALAAPDAYGATTWQVGLAIGGYGLSQCLMQIPFGLASDRWGRRPVIMVALGLFVTGSILAAWSNQIEWVIAGRFLQGGAAIAGVLLAWIGDVVPSSKRSTAMAGVGGSIAAAFGLSMVLGPWLFVVQGLAAIFWLNAGLGVLAGLLLLRASDSRVVSPQALSFSSAQFHRGKLSLLCMGIALNHFILMSVFLTLPSQLVARGWSVAEHGGFYLVALLLSLVCMSPALYRERQGRQNSISWAIALLALALTGLQLQVSSGQLAFAALALFSAFNFLEASLPARATTLADAEHRGLVMGIYSTSQFVGIALGGSVGGFLIHAWGETGLYAVAMTLCFIFVLFERWLAKSPAMA
ncbi:MAG: MFS transporter [Pseudomonadales bacterium]